MANKRGRKRKLNQTYKKWSFGTINIRSGKEKDEGAKIYAVVKEAARAGLTFCCLQEVRWRNQGSKLIQLDTGEEYEFHWCGQKGKREAGVGIIVRVHPDVEIQTPDYYEPRVMAMNIRVHGFNLRIVNGYAPTEANGSESQKQQFYSHLKKAAVTTEKHQKLIVVGDFNATTSIAKYRCSYDGKNIIQDSDCNDNGDRLKSFCRSHQLSISSTFFKHRLLHRYTWYSNDGKTRKIIDYVLVESYVQQYVTDCRVKRGFDFDSDHRLLKTTMTTPTTRHARRRYNKQPRKPSLHVKSLLDGDTQKKFADTVNRELRNFTIQPENTSEMSDKIIKVLSMSAEQTLPRKAKVKKENEIWKNDSTLNELLDVRLKLSMNSPEYKAATKNIKKRVNHLRNEKLCVEAEEINHHANKREIEGLFRSIKADGSTFKNTKRKEVCDPEKLKNHFQKHFSLDEPVICPVELEEMPDFIAKLQLLSTDTIKTDAPDRDEILNVMKKLKNGKATNDIPSEFLKYAMTSEELLCEIESLMKSIWKTHSIPASWKHTKLVALWKGASKGSVKDPNAYRGLQVGSSLCKLLTIIIIDRLKLWYDQQLLEQQQGFRSGRGTADGIYITKRIQQITDKMRRPVYTLFVDLSAAFDHVIRQWMFKSIYQRFPIHANTTIIQLIEALYQYTTTSLAEMPDDLFELLLGVRQGGPESPPLYNLYMDYVMRVFMEQCKKLDIKFLKLKYRIRSTATTREDRCNKTYYGDQTVDWAGYADDLELFFEDSDSLQKGLQLLDETFIRFHLSINVSKTKTMIMNYGHINKDSNTYPETISNLHSAAIENVKVFRYLGDDIKYDEPSTGDAEVDLRIALAERKFYELAKKLLNKKILLQTRIYILNAIVRSRLTYSCQTWNLTKRLMDRINSSYISMLRKMVKGGYRRKGKKGSDNYHFVLNNVDILAICKTEKVEEYVKWQQTKYLAHLARQPNTSITKRLLFNDDKARKPGRQITLVDIVMEAEQCTEDQFYRKALNREY